MEHQKIVNLLDNASISYLNVEQKWNKWLIGLK